MTSKKTTRRALLTSVLSLLLCLSMLVGTTFAWFTDSVESGTNVIAAGNLDVELKYASTPDGTYESVEGKGDLFVAPAGATKGLWEPGHTEVAYLQVHNAGTLTLQYNLSVSPYEETIGKTEDGKDIQLSKILKFAATEPSEQAPAAFTRETAQEAAAASNVKLTEYQKINVSLEPGDSHYIALVVYMPESVGNEANYRGTDIPTIKFGVTLLATQEAVENDSFGDDYDDKAMYPDVTHWVDAVVASATTDAVGGTFVYENEAKTFRATGKATGPVSVTIAHTIPDEDLIQILSDDATVSYNIDVEGQEPDSDVTVEIFVGEGLDSVTVYHKAELIDAEYNKDTGFVKFVTKDFSPFTIAYCAEKWDGESVDTDWYDDDETATEFTLSKPDQLAGLSKLVDEGVTFEGKTIKLDASVDLAGKIFEPIGSYRKGKPFKGTFDGQGHTIYNLSQNTWALDNGYYYGDLGLGLFGKVEDATVKDLTMDGASISGESAICGAVAATAYGDCTFENITVKNSKVNDYQYYAGGVVGWASGDHTYKNINVDASTVIGSQWGDFGNANGGIIGGAGTSGTYHFEDCTVACRIDATNDVVSAYQWYNYRNSGMLIGQVENGNSEVRNVTANNVTCKNVTVIYGDWANYTYCEFAGTGYPYVRVQAGVSVDGYSNVRYGHPTDANGNTVIDDNHVHNDGEAHHKLIVFDNLFGGPANHRYCYYGIAEHPGVTVIYNNK